MKEEELLQAEVDVAVLIEGDLQHVVLFAGKFSRHRGGLIVPHGIGGDAHA